MQWLKRLPGTFLVMFLAFFMLVIFGPAEIFFKNYNELGFVYGEFGWKFWGIGLGLAVVATLVISVFPEILRKIVLALALGACLGAYVQCMFLNAGVKSLGQDAMGYLATTQNIVKSLIAWAICVIVVVVLAFVVKKWKLPIYGIAGFLLAVQLVGYVSLFITAEDSALKYSEDETLCLSSAEQYTLSSNENIIFILLDAFSNEFLYEYDLQDASWRNVMKDFTYYNNADCNIYGTYPSLTHMLTGYPLDLTAAVDDFTYASWTNETTNSYFDLLKEHGYKVNLYVDYPERILGNNSLALIEDKVDNISTTTESILIDYPLLYKTMIKMSCYRYAPDLIKNRFYVTYDKYGLIATDTSNAIDLYNYEFYEKITNGALTLDDSSNYFVFEHLNGTHEFTNNALCEQELVYDRNETITGVFVMLEEYFNRLKELDVYDNSTIIVLADHGMEWNGQPIFFIKEKNTTRETMAETNAFIDYDTIVPTIVANLGEDSEPYGKSIYDYEDNVWRERVFVTRYYDENYPSVERYDGTGGGGSNVYRVYRYTGDMWYLISVYQQMQFETIPMTDSYY